MCHLALMNRIQIRRASIDDLGLISPLFDLYRQFYEQDSDLAKAENFLAQRLQHNESVIFLAFDGADAVGFTQLYPGFSSVSMARTFLLNDLYVIASHRRHGVGALLLKAAVAHAQSAQAVRISLTTNVANTTAQAVYEAQGWEREKAFLTYNFKLNP
jgi:GNAT superfamily N-acetyltransferase